MKTTAKFEVADLFADFAKGTTEDAIPGSFEFEATVEADLPIEVSMIVGETPATWGYDGGSPAEFITREYPITSWLVYDEGKIQPQGDWAGDNFAEDYEVTLTEADLNTLRAAALAAWAVADKTPKPPVRRPNITRMGRPVYGLRADDYTAEDALADKGEAEYEARKNGDYDCSDDHYAQAADRRY